MRHKRQGINWPVITSVVVAVIACLMVREVHVLHQQRLQRSPTELHESYSSSRKVDFRTTSISHPTRMTHMKDPLMSSKKDLAARP